MRAVDISEIAQGLPSVFVNVKWTAMWSPTWNVPSEPDAPLTERSDSTTPGAFSGRVSTVSVGAGSPGAPGAPGAPSEPSLPLQPENSRVE
jgi:hypothetical protein